MKALIVYDSFFGNTEQIARAIGAALGSPEEVEVLRVNEVKPEQLAKAPLLIVGSPTRGFRPSPAIKELLKAIPHAGLKGVRVAAFDTRISVADTNSALLRFLVGIFGYAAKPIADGLARKGGQLALAPEGFIVEGTEGPLKAGELERAADWARQVVAES